MSEKRTMSKDNIVRILIGLIVLVAIYEAYQLSAQRRADEIDRITTQADSLRVENQMIRQAVAFRDSLRAEREAEIVELRRVTDSLRVEVANVEARRVEERIELLSLEDAQDVAQAFRDAFPLLEEEMKVMSYPPPGSGFEIDWLTVPLGDASAFIDYKNQADAYREEVGLLERVDTLQQSENTLQREITSLVEANAAEYQRGYERALDSYLDLVPRYVNELGRPSLELPNKWGVAFGAVLGGALGVGVCAAARR